jgi:hypothetical protein
VHWFVTYKSEIHSGYRCQRRTYSGMAAMVFRALTTPRAPTALLQIMPALEAGCADAVVSGRHHRQRRCWKIRQLAHARKNRNKADQCRARACLSYSHGTGAQRLMTCV